MSCNNCGNDLQLTTNPALKDQWDVDIELVCYSCGNRDRVRDLLRESHKDDGPPKRGELPYMDGRIFAVQFLEPTYLPGGD